MLITVFAPRNVHLLEIAAVRDAFFEANCRIPGHPPYRLQLVGEQASQIESASGVKVIPDAGINVVNDKSDTLIVVGPYGAPDDPSLELASWLVDQARHARRFGSTCTGVFLLANAGLLSGGRVTTHWQYACRLAAEHPDLDVQADSIFIRDGQVFSSAGVTSAIDLTLALIEEDHGRALALWVARRLVVFLKRPGGQSQFSAALTARSAVTSPIDKIRLHILDNPQRDLALSTC